MTQNNRSLSRLVAELHDVDVIEELTIHRNGALITITFSTTQEASESDTKELYNHIKEYYNVYVTVRFKDKPIHEKVILELDDNKNICEVVELDKNNLYSYYPRYFHIEEKSEVIEDFKLVESEKEKENVGTKEST